MRTLGQVLEHQGPAGATLPEILPSLTRRGIRLRRAQVALAAAQPNGGKSLFSLWYAISTQVRCLYLSADTDPHTTMLRAAAIRTGMSIDQVEGLIEKDVSQVRSALAELNATRFSFDPNPGLEDIELTVAAYEEAFGAYPELIVVDNLMNVLSGLDNEWQGMREVMSAMHTLARYTEACVLVLHHVSENDSKALYPAPRRAIQGKVSQLPELILTLAIEPASGIFRIACVKNRHGVHDASGEDYETVYVDASRMTLYDSQQEMQMAAKRREWG